MSWLLGGKKKPPAQPTGPGVTSTMDQLSNQVEKMDKKIEYLEKKAKMELTEAKKAGTKTSTAKSKAMLHMKRYKLHQKTINQLAGQRDNMEAQRSALEMAQLMAGNVAAMKASSDQMKNMVDVDKVDDVIADVIDIHDRVAEASDMISQPMGIANDVDEDELEQELNDFLMEDEAEEEQLEDLPDIDDSNLVPDLPEPGKQKVVPSADKDAEDLMGWMNS